MCGWVGENHRSMKREDGIGDCGGEKVKEDNICNVNNENKKRVCLKVLYAGLIK